MPLLSFSTSSGVQLTASRTVNVLSWDVGTESACSNNGRPASKRRAFPHPGAVRGDVLQTSAPGHAIRTRSRSPHARVPSSLGRDVPGGWRDRLYFSATASMKAAVPASTVAFSLGVGVPSLPYSQYAS